MDTWSNKPRLFTLTHGTLGVWPVTHLVSLILLARISKKSHRRLQYPIQENYRDGILPLKVSGSTQTNVFPPTRLREPILAHRADPPYSVCHVQPTHTYPSTGLKPPRDNLQSLLNTFGMMRVQYARMPLSLTRCLVLVCWGPTRNVTAPSRGPIGRNVPMIY